jgi:superfamily I DNA/RNA helicase
MHRAKGLDFYHVIVLAPKSNLGDPLEVDSKRKLIDVALTRAKKEEAFLGELIAMKLTAYGPKLRVLQASGIRIGCPTSSKSSTCCMTCGPDAE